MICSPCRIGGTYNAQASTHPAADVVEHYLRTAREQHARCLENGCECRHYVGPQPSDPALRHEGGAD